MPRRTSEIEDKYIAWSITTPVKVEKSPQKNDFIPIEVRQAHKQKSAAISDGSPECFTLCGPHNKEDPGIFIARSVEPFWLPAALSSSRRNEVGPVSKSVLSF